MRLLFISGTYCPSHGGAEISAHTLLKNIKKNYDTDILVLTDFRYTKKKRKFRYDKIDLIGTNHKNREKAIKNTINEFKPDLILTQLMWSDKALEIGKKNKIPTILRICKIPFSLDIRNESKYAPTSIICVSNAVKEYVKKEWKREGEIVIPAIELNKKIIVSKKYKLPFNRKCITMFNPLKRKGGELFKEIARKMPDEKFAVVHGWSSLKNNARSKEFSDKLIKRMCESQGTKFTGKKPSYTDLSDCSNIKILRPTEDVWKIYAQTKILLIPSQWEETFGRVAIESMANGIPTIGSNVGGLKEAIGKGGILIKDYSHPNEWIKEIKRLRKEENYNFVSKKGIKWVEQSYSLDEILQKVFLFFEEVISNFKKGS